MLHHKFVTLELTNVTLQDYVKNINDPWKYQWLNRSSPA